MRRFVVLIIVVGVTLISASVALSQDPGGGPPKPPNGDGPPPPNDGRGRDRDGRGRDRNGDGQNGGGQSDTEAVAVVAEVFVSNPLLGGDNTVFDESVEAFTNHLPGFTAEQIAEFEEGDELFEQSFVSYYGDDAAVDDGLGPVFNANSCESCHVEDGRGRPPEFVGESESGFLIRLAIPQLNANGGTLPDAIYGGQLQDMSVEGVAREGDVVIHYTEITGTYADGTPFSLRVPTYTIANPGFGPMDSAVTYSPRVANHMVGLGLLEALSEDTILSFADADDSNGDGISGRPNYVWDVLNSRLSLGRFGWKANQPNLLQQTAGAYNGDMGITTSIFGHQPCTEGQASCMDTAAGGTPEASDEDVRLVTFYASSLSVPAQRNADDPLVQEGEQLFEQAQCSSCHIPTMTTGTHPTIPQLSNQYIQPFTDLLLHDMGEGLADGQTDFQASGNEWRTPPLWGIGLFETVNGHTYYLHDGRARNLEEAILWHGGEAALSREWFMQMTAEERAALIAFLQSL